MAKEVKIVLTNRLTYTLIFTGVLLSMAWFVMAVAGVSHDASELEGVCKSDGTNCVAITETDPTVPANLKDGITWTEISNRPAGLDDGDQVGSAGSLVCRYVSCTPSESDSPQTCTANCNGDEVILGVEGDGAFFNGERAMSCTQSGWGATVCFGRCCKIQ